MSTKIDRGDETNHHHHTPRTLFRSRRFRWHILAFVLVNCLVYAWMWAGHGWVTFDSVNYSQSAYHYIQDDRSAHPDALFDLPTALAQYDAQWYLRIADTGYPEVSDSIPRATGAPGPIQRTDASYAFSPLFPLLVAGVHAVVPSIVLSAFIVTQVLLILAFWAVYWLIARWYNEELASKTVWLLFLSPLSVFFRGYFTEATFVVLLVAALHWLRTKEWLRTGVATGLLLVTRFVGLAVALTLLIETVAARINKQITWRRLCLVGVAVAVPLLGFMILCAIRTGNPFYFIAIRSEWRVGLPPVFSTLWSVGHILSLPLHGFHTSLIDTLAIIGGGVLLLASQPWLPKVWWRLSLLLWLIPILTTDTMSASRYQMINIPLFLFVAYALKKRWQYVTVLTLSALGLLIVSLGFVNWHWIG